MCGVGEEREMRISSVLIDPFTVNSIFALSSCLFSSPVLDPEGETLAGVEEILAESVVGHKVEVGRVVEIAAPKILFPKHHGYSQVLDGAYEVLVSQQRPPHPRTVFLLDLSR